MKMYNYNFSGGIDSDKYPITTTYSNNQTILVVVFLIIKNVTIKMVVMQILIFIMILLVLEMKRKQL